MDFFPIPQSQSRGLVIEPCKISCTYDSGWTSEFTVIITPESLHKNCIQINFPYETDPRCGFQWLRSAGMLQLGEAGAFRYPRNNGKVFMTTQLKLDPSVEHRLYCAVLGFNLPANLFFAGPG